MKQHDITLCLIVKDEEKFIKTCIESVRPLVREILIADTGSSDNTCSICRQYTDHVEAIDFKGGFSVARNHLLQQVKTCWVLFLDADEYFDNGELEKLSDLLENISKETQAFSCLRYNFFPSGAFYTSDTVKLFRSDPEIYYSGVVVDSIRPSILQKKGHIEQIPVILNHFGHCRSISVREQKAQKYLDMIDRELAECPGNYKVIGYKALILRTLGRLDEARDWGKKALFAAPGKGHPHFVWGHIERAFNNHEAAIEAYSRALAFDGENAIYLNSRGVANLTCQRLSAAKLDFKQGLKLFPYQVHFSINLGLIEQSLGNYAKAAGLFFEIGQKHPAFMQNHFAGCAEVDPHSGYSYDTIFNFRGLSYHWAYCEAKSKGLI